MIVDASVIVAANSESEAAHVVARAWYAAALEQGLSAPVIVWSEVAAAIARQSGRADFAQQVIANLKASPIRFVPVDEDLATRAAEIARSQRIRGCDAIYVALAAMTGEPLVTLDDEQIARGAAVATVMRPAIAAGENQPVDN